MAFGLKSLTSGILGTYSEVSKEELEKNYAQYLMDDETITLGFKLVRDVLIFSDKRLILMDKQGATGIKMKVISINLFSIVSVEMETSGVGFDDSELTFTYISSPDLRGYHVTYANHKLEFPKKYNVQSLYRLFQSIAYENCIKINSLN